MADENIQTNIGESQASVKSQPQASENNDKSKTGDHELDALLDNALEDFSNPPKVAAAAAATTSLSASTEKLASADAVRPADGTNDEMFEKFFREAMAEGEGADGEGPEELQHLMSQLMSDNPALNHQLSNLGETLIKGDSSQEGQKNFEEALQETLGSLSQNAQDLQNQLPEDEVMKMMAQLAMEDGMAENATGDDPGFMSMMQGVMKSLLSKDVLYPSLKEISEKYPGWLEANKEKVSAEEYEKYEKQHRLMQTITSEFEKEAPGDSDSEREARFKTIMDSMQQMQELGQPPKEIVGDMPQGFPLDESGMPKLPGMGGGAEQCVVM